MGILTDKEIRNLLVNPFYVSMGVISKEEGDALYENNIDEYGEEEVNEGINECVENMNMVGKK